MQFLRWSVVALCLMFLSSGAAVAGVHEFPTVEPLDDMEEYVADGSVDAGSSDLEIGYEKPGSPEGDRRQQLIGLRFQNVTIPAGEEIVRAYIQFARDEEKMPANPFEATIWGEASGNPTQFDNIRYTVSSRAKTVASVAWTDAPEWTVQHEQGEAQQTPDVTTIINEIVARPDWQNGNAMSFIIAATGNRTAESFDGEPSLAPKLVIETPTQVSFQVSSGSDDAEEGDDGPGVVSLTSSDLELTEDHAGTPQTIGIRFADALIPAGARISEAYIQFACDNIKKNSETATVVISGQVGPNPETFTSAANNVSSRPKTGTSVTWANIPKWLIKQEAGPDQRTPDISPVLQEMVDHPEYREGDALAFILTGSGTREAESYDGSSADAPVLYVKYAGELSGPSNDKYRLVWNDDPTTTMLVAWDQLRGANPMVCYGTEDHGTDWAAYPHTRTPTRVTPYRGMNNHFAKLTGLLPDTAYYFVIKDSETVSERMWFKTAPDTPKPFTCIFGGDTKSSGSAYLAGLNSNKMVAKLRPLFVQFNGDFNSGSGLDEASWKMWLTDWATLTKSADGRMYPLLPVHGNHENGDYEVLHNLFDTPSRYSYYSLSFGGDLLHVISLNSEIDVMPAAFDAQLAWLGNDLASHSHFTFKTAGYHKPVRPHTSGKGENDYLMPWARLFYNHGLSVSFDADSHMNKITFPLRPGDGPDSYMGFARDDQFGTIYAGEGSWGAWARPADDDKPWTLTSARIQQFKWVHIHPEQDGQPARFEIRTVVTGTHAPDGSLVDHVAAVAPNMEDDVFAIPENINLVDIPFYGTVITYPFEAVAGTPPLAPANLTGEALSYSDIVLNWTYENDPGSPAARLVLERKTGQSGDWMEIENKISPDVTTYAQGDLHDGTDYFYRLKAGNIFGFSDYSNEALVSTPVDNRVRAEFSHGLDGYNGTIDLELVEPDPDRAYTTGTTISVDNNSGFGDRQHGLIRFRDIFGAAPGQIPWNAEITNAELRVRTMNTTGNVISLHRMLEAWTEQATWNSMVGGIDTDDVQAASTADDRLVAPQAGNYHTFDVTATVTAWLKDPEFNFGWALRNDGSNGWDFYASEWTVGEQRPLLTVYYSIPGDINHDGRVDRDDASKIMQHRNQPAAACPECDIDGDGTITVMDMRKLIRLCTCPGCVCPQ